MSPACDHCYAESLSKRFGHDVWGGETERRLFGDKHWNEPRRWDAAAASDGVTRRVFCASMGDVFEDRRDLDAERLRLWLLIRDTPHLEWLLLTKRPQHVKDQWPSMPVNARLGTTVEDQPHMRLRVPRLLDAYSQVGGLRPFLSIEPLLGPVSLGSWLNLGVIGWVIVGGESGPGARPMHPQWARSLRDEAVAAGVPFHFKQAGDRLAKDWGCGDRSGRLLAEFPEDLQLREFPHA